MSFSAGASKAELPLELSSLRAYAGEPGAIEGVGFWPRVAARVIDFVVHYIVGLATGVVFGIFIVIGSAGRPNPFVLARMQRTGIAVLLFSTLGAIVYEIICEGVHGSTLGKLALSMGVVQEDGTPCRVGSAVIRSFAYLIDALFFGLIGYFAMQKTPQAQRHGDEWAHTIVCKRSAIAPQHQKGAGRFLLALMFGLMADSALLMVGLLLNVA